MLRRLLRKLRHKPAPVALETSAEAMDYITAAFAAKAAIRNARDRRQFDQAAGLIRVVAINAQVLTGHDWSQVARYRDQTGDATPSLYMLQTLFNARFRAHYRPFVA